MKIKDVAKLANVSISTVSKIINNKADNINPDTIDRVLKIVKEYNYEPYSNIKNRNNTKKFIIALLVKNNYFNQSFFQGIFDEVITNKYSVLVFSSNNSLEQELKNISNICQNKYDGVIWQPVSKDSLNNIKYFKEKEIPFLINSNFHMQKHYNLDYKSFGFQCTEYLIEKDHRNIALIVSNKDDLEIQDFIEGFKQSIFNSNAQFSDDLIIDLNNPNLLETLYLKHISAIVAPNEIITNNVTKILNNAGLSTPKDISIIGVVDDSYKLLEHYNFTSILIPFYKFGKFLGKNLISICENQKTYTKKFIHEIKISEMQSVSNLSSTKKNHIISIGSVNIDFTMNVNTFPQPGKAVKTRIGSINVGGKGANQAVGVAKLKSDSYLIGKVGHDYYSSLVYSCMNKHNVNSIGLYKDEQEETGKAYIHLLPSGESMITIFSGANSTLSEKEVLKQENHFKNAKYCLVSTEIPINLIKLILQMAKKFNVTTILKPAACEELNPTILKNVDIFVPNEKEAQLLCPLDLTSLEDKANYFRSLGVKTVIITLGKDGVYIDSPNLKTKIPAINDFKVEDSTGGADAFISALAVYLELGYNLERSIKIALYAAAFCVSKIGVINALVDKNTLENYIIKKEPSLLQR
jgi:ribokinase